MFRSYLDFDLLIEPRGERYCARVLSSPAGEGESTFDLPAAEVDISPEVRWPGVRRGSTLRDIVPQDDRTETPRAGNLRDVGGRLFDAVFAGQVGACWSHSLAAAEREQTGLRLRLRLGMVPSLARLPWECLYQRDGDVFFARSNRTPVVRYLDLPLPQATLTVPPPLRILTVISSPIDQARLDVEGEWAGLQDALARLIGRGTLKIDRLDVATIRGLQRALRTTEYHVLHYIGHGGFDDEAGTGVLILEDDGERSHAVTAEHLVGLLRDHPTLRLVLLNACEGAEASASNIFSGVAQSLGRGGVPAAIAMQREVTDAAAVTLSREFYSAIADGYPVDAALAEARKAMFNEGLGAEWATPVLYMRSRDGRIFAIGATRDSVPPERAIPVPPPTEKPPVIEGFVGRETEMARYREQLATQHIVFITGIAGVGKTWLAATLARAHGDAGKVFWHAFDAGQGLDVLLWKLAAFLAHHGQDQWWSTLSAARQTRDALPPPEVLLQYLVDMVSGQGFLLCFDNFQHVDDDPRVDKLLHHVRAAASTGGVDIVVASRRRPRFEMTAAPVVLEGLSENDVRALLAARRVAVSTELAARLHAATEGIAEFVSLAANVLARGGDPARIVGRLAEADDIERYLIKQVDAGLDDDERAVMCAAAVLGRPATRGAIEAALDGRRVRRIVLALAEEHLLDRVDAAWGDAYVQHAIVRHFYYDHDWLSVAERKAMHARVALHFELDEPDALWAAHHYARSGDAARGADLATRDVWRSINQFRARELLSVLKDIRAPQVPGRVGARALAAMGTSAAFLGFKHEARGYFEQVLAATTAAADRGLRAQAYLGLADCRQREAPRDALEWIRRGQEELAGGDALLEAELGVKEAAVRMTLGDLPAAEAAARASLARLSADPTQLRARALIQLASICAVQGRPLDSLPLSEEALTISRQIGDTFRELATRINLAADKEILGDWAAARGEYEEALDIAERLGAVEDQVALNNNFALLLMMQRELPAAEARFAAALEAARSHDLKDYQVYILNGLADLAIRREQWRAADAALDEAEAIAGEVGTPDALPETFTLRAAVHLGRGKSDLARVAAEMAAIEGRRLGRALDEGKAFRALGRAQAAAGDGAAAEASFTASLKLLEATAPYEAARTRWAWGRARSAAGDTQAGGALLREAALALQALGVATEGMPENTAVGDPANTILSGSEVGP